MVLLACTGHSRTMIALHSCTGQLDAKLQRFQTQSLCSSELGDYSSSGSNNLSKSDSPVPHPPTAVMHRAGLPRMAFGPGCLLQAALQAYQLAALQAYQLAAPQHPGQAGTSDLGHSLPAQMHGNLAWYII